MGGKELDVLGLKAEMPPHFWTSHSFSVSTLSLSISPRLIFHLHCPWIPSFFCPCSLGCSAASFRFSKVPSLLGLWPAEATSSQYCSWPQNGWDTFCSAPAAGDVLVRLTFQELLIMRTVVARLVYARLVLSSLCTLFSLILTRSLSLWSSCFTNANTVEQRC